MRIAVTAVLPILTICVALTFGARQSPVHRLDENAGAAGANRWGERYSGDGEEAAVLFSGMGPLHHAITTKNPEAQKFFDQGLTLFYAFNFEEAQRSFRRASELDPQAAMPYWGLALALGPSYNGGAFVSEANTAAAREALGKAKALAPSGPKNESAYVETLARLFTSSTASDPAERLREYLPLARELSRSHPDDPDAAAIYAEGLMELHTRTLWTADGKATDVTPEIMTVLEGVLRRWPDHPGANHLYIHTMEASPHPEKALACAKRLEKLVPGAGHLVHMPSHIYLRSGDYAAAVKSDEDAIAVDKKYLESRAIRNMDYVLGYAEHNLSFLIYAASMSGEYERARAAAKQLEDFGRGALVENSQMRVEAYLSAPLSVELRFAHWDEILRAPEPDAKLHGFEYFWHYARGSAFAVKGDKQKAAVERDAMKRESRQLFGNMFGMLPNDWNTARAIAENALDARFSASNGDAAGAVSHWRAAVAAEDGMAYHEPPDWNYPVRESLGAQLLRSGKASEADSVFRDDLARNPRNPRSLFGLWKALEKEKKMNEAAEARRQFEKVWAGQKVDLRLEDF